MEGYNRDVDNACSVVRAGCGVFAADFRERRSDGHEGLFDLLGSFVPLLF